jgi:hypothetical protein
MSNKSLEGVLVKRAHIKESYTDQQLIELAKCSDLDTGPEYFLTNFFYIQHPTRGRIKYDPYDYQKELIDVYHKHRFSINLLGRQMGKCCTKEAYITVKNNQTNQVYDIPIGEFYRRQKDPSIDISCYEQNKSYPDTATVAQNNSHTKSTISKSTSRKFVDQVDLGDQWSISSDTGWQPLSTVMQTVEYERWDLLLQNGMTLGCADNHILFDADMNEVFAKDLVPGSIVQTKQGPSAVVDINNTGTAENMYDVQVLSDCHRYYSNGILSHNTATAAGYLLWYAMFVPDSTILIAAHKYTGAQEIMQRIRYAYELCPDHIRAGVVSYNKGSIDFDNGSRLVSATTTETTGRGMAISLLYCLDGDTTTVKVRNKNTQIEEDITLAELYGRLVGAEQVLT